MSHMSHAKCRMVLVNLLLISSNAMGSIIAYDSLGLNNTYVGEGVWFGHYENANETCAQQFTPTDSGWLEEIYASIEADSHTADQSYTLRLRADASCSAWDCCGAGADRWIHEGPPLGLTRVGPPQVSVGQMRGVQIGVVYALTRLFLRSESVS